MLHVPSTKLPAEQTTTQRDVGRMIAGAEVRILGLTILYHPDLERVGERAFPNDARSWKLSRNGPEFAPPGRGRKRPLGDACISRQPIAFYPGEQPGSLVLDTRSTRTSVEVNGERVSTTLQLPAPAIVGGVVLLLGSGIVLLLHRVDPIARPSIPRWGLLGESPALVRACRDVAQVAELDIPVLIRGETGTGKELVARAIHQASSRCEGPYVAVNMASIPASLASSELFGASKGAFTGAHKAHAGYFKRAHGGTLFLDEVGEMGIDIQVLLLRALENREIQPVGADRSQKVDVRFVSATDADLETAVADGRFRAPVLHRLNGYTIYLPALRERQEDFGRLFVHFLRAEAELLGLTQQLAPRRRPWVPAALVARLARWHWPGNVRQLRNVVRQLMIAHRGMDNMSMTPALANMLRTNDEPSFNWPPSISNKPTFEPPSAVAPTASATLAPRDDRPSRETAPRAPRDIGEDELVAALRAHQWRLHRTAKALRISRPALYSLIAKSDRVRTAAELTRAEITQNHELHSGDISAMAQTLEVSVRALKRRMNQLGFQAE